MADSSKILDGSYKGIPIRIDSATIDGGRKYSVREFPNRSTQTVEDLGGRPRSYSLTIVVAPRTSNVGGATDEISGYFEYRDRLLDLFDKGGPGTLIHPLYGRIDNIVAVDYTLEENFTSFGDAKIRVNFEIDTDRGVPRKVNTDLSEIAYGNRRVRDAVKTDVSDNWSLDGRFKSNYGDASSKLEALVDAATAATDYLQSDESAIDDWNSFLGDTKANSNTVILDSDSLADKIVTLYDKINDLYGESNDEEPTPFLASYGVGRSPSLSSTEAFAGMFGFGSHDELDIDPTTAARTQRRNNRALLNGSANALALSYAYENATQLEYRTVREIDATQNRLEDQYLDVSGSDVSDGTLSALSDLRVQVQEFLNEQRKNAQQIITVKTHTIPARVMSYQYYGESSSVEDIMSLNDLSDVSFVEGEIEILTS